MTAVAALRSSRSWLAACVLALIVVMNPVHAQERIGVMAAALDSAGHGDQAVMLDATFEFELPPALEDALQKGVALYFVTEFELSRDRWYWFDKKVVDTSLTYRLSYSPLTRQYRLARGGLSQPFDSLDEALSLLKTVRNWHVFDRGALVPGTEYSAQVRMRFDTSQLPKPFQVNAITSREWSLASDWRGVKVRGDFAK